MRIVITDVPDMKPLVLEGIQAVILAADDGADDGASPVIARGDPYRLAQLAAVVLASIRQKLGANAFEAVVKAARGISGEDITDAVRLPPATPGTKP